MKDLVPAEATLAKRLIQSHCLLPCRKDVAAREALRVLLLLVKQGANGLNLTGKAHPSSLLQWTESFVAVLSETGKRLCWEPKLSSSPYPCIRETVLRQKQDAGKTAWPCTIQMLRGILLQNERVCKASSSGLLILSTTSPFSTLPHEKWIGSCWMTA